MIAPVARLDRCPHLVAGAIDEPGKRDRACAVPGVAFDHEKSGFGVGFKASGKDRIGLGGKGDIAVGEGRVCDQPFIGADRAEISARGFGHGGKVDPAVLEYIGPAIGQVQSLNLLRACLGRKTHGGADRGRGGFGIRGDQSIAVGLSAGLDLVADDRDFKRCFSK